MHNAALTCRRLLLRGSRLGRGLRLCHCLRFCRRRRVCFTRPRSRKRLSTPRLPAWCDMPACASRLRQPLSVRGLLPPVSAHARACVAYRGG